MCSSAARSRAATCRSDFRRSARARYLESPSTTPTSGSTDAGREPGWKRAGGRAGCRFRPRYIRLTDERRGQSVDDGDLSPLVAQGWYVSGTYAVTRKRNRFGRVEVAARYETMSFGSRSGVEAPSTSARSDVVLGNVDRATTLGANWLVNRWVKVQANIVRENIGRPSMGPRPGHSGFWSSVFRLQLTL